MKYWFAICISLSLASCGGDQGSSGEAPAADVSDEDVAAYQEKVSRKVSDSVVNSFVREYGISEEEARCLVDDIGVADLGRAETDPEVQARIRACGVDPAVVR
jgi:hypothetical protein